LNSDSSHIIIVETLILCFVIGSKFMGIIIT